MTTTYFSLLITTIISFLIFVIRLVIITFVNDKDEDEDEDDVMKNTKCPFCGSQRIVYLNKKAQCITCGATSPFGGKKYTKKVFGADTISSRKTDSQTHYTLLIGKVKKP